MKIHSRLISTLYLSLFGVSLFAPLNLPGAGSGSGGGKKGYASYWLTDLPSLVVGQNAVFNLPQTHTGIEYDPTNGIFTVPSGVYAIDFFATPNLSFENTLNLNVNGTIIPTPSLAGSMVVMPFSNGGNQISAQATGNWSPQTGDIGSFFFAYSSIAIHKIQTPSLGNFACLYNSTGQELATGQNVLFPNQISLTGITYDNTAGVLTLPPGTYSVSYFSIPSGSLNLVANGVVVPNAPLSGSATIVTLSNSTNTLALQAQNNVSLSAPGANQCSAMITVYPVTKNGAPNKGRYASFFLTTGSDGVNAGENVIFNDQVTLSGIKYDNTTGVFTLPPGTYTVTYFFAPFSMPSVNMYVNNQLILNSPLGGSSTVLKLTAPRNTLTLQYISAGSFSAPGANQSWASIAISQVSP